MGSESDFPPPFFANLLLKAEFVLAAILDRSGKVLVGNKAMEDITGPPVQGLQFEEFLTRGSGAVLLEILEELHKKGGERSVMLHVAGQSTAAPNSYNFQIKSVEENRFLLFGEPMQRLSNKEAEQYMIITNELSATARELEKTKKTLLLRAEELERTNERLNEEIVRRTKTQREKEGVIQELEKALAEVKRLSGMLPICASCKKIRDDTGYWRQIESYISSHSEAQFSHGICPDCARDLYPELYDED